MTSDLYLTDLVLSTRDWYVGLEVTFEITIGCWHGDCANCSAGLNYGLTSTSDCDCGDYPSNTRRFGSADVTCSCGQEQTISYRHVVDQGDIDAINAGKKRAYAHISRGTFNMCYERHTVYVAEEPAKGEITRYEYPAEVGSGDGVDIDVNIKNTGKSDGDFTLKLVDVDSETELDSVAIGILSSGASKYDIHLACVMASRDMNLAIELWRAS